MICPGKEKERITIKRGNKDVIPRLKISAAAEKLARYEDTELDPDQLAEMDQVFRFKCEEVTDLCIKLNHMKSEVFKVLDEVDGQIVDDPVSLIREKLEEIIR